MIVKHPHLSRADRTYRSKFPAEVQGDIQFLLGPLLAIAEIMTTGAIISIGGNVVCNLKTAATSFCDSFNDVRRTLKAQAVVDPSCYSPAVIDCLTKFDREWCDFEQSYVFSLLPPPSSRVLEQNEEMNALLQSTVSKGLRSELFTFNMLEELDPGVLFAIPRLAVLNALRNAPAELFLQLSLSLDTKTNTGATGDDTAGDNSDMLKRPSSSSGSGSNSASSVNDIYPAMCSTEFKAHLTSTVSTATLTQTISTEGIAWVENHCLSKYIKDSSSICKIIRMLSVISDSEVVILERKFMDISSTFSSSASSSSSNSSSQEHTQFLHTLYVDICAIADRLHSGETASAFRAATHTCITSFLNENSGSSNCESSNSSSSSSSSSSPINDTEATSSFANTSLEGTIV